MFTNLRSLLVLCAAALTASAATEDIVSRQVDTAFGEKLVVDVEFGSVTVKAGADDKVTLEAHRKLDFGDEAKEKEYLAAVPITLSKEANVVTVRSRGQRLHERPIGHCQLDANYTLHVPKKFETALQTDGGRISVSDITGNLNAHTNGGAIEIENCQGPIQIETSGGGITVADGKGSLSAVTSGGGIRVHNFSGDTDVQTSGGGLNLDKISGKIVGKTSGGGIRARIPDVVGDVELETSAGNIDFSVAANAGLEIDANTSVGNVVSSLPIQASDVRREHLRGTLNGGGKSVTLGTSAGNITIQPISELAKLSDSPPRHE